MNPGKPDKKEVNFNPGTGEDPAGIYVHIPFCRSKCPYCSFVSFQNMGEGIKNKYMEALVLQAQEMASHPWTRARKFHSLFIGGGTPSSVDPHKLASFIAACLALYDFTAGPDSEPEVTLEANPNSITGEMVQLFRHNGVNRMSLGIQSFFDPVLRNIGRRHTAQEAINAFALARAGGFTNINVDLMYGLPGQSVATWQDSLQQALALGPEHISVYELTIEPGTSFAEAVSRGKVELPDEETVLEMFERAREVLSAASYCQYEISNYARQGFACIHNINYWENGSYIGLGGGAFSCFSGVRIKSLENPVLFTHKLNKGRPVYKEAEFLPLPARFRETVIMGLRMTSGVSTQRLQDRFGMTPRDHYGDILVSLMQQGLVSEKDGRLRLTSRGLPLANQVLSALV